MYTCRLFYYRVNPWFRQGFIITDIDGTVTRSDFVGRWLIQKGLILLFQKLTMRGLPIIYLSNRPITMARSTVHFLRRRGLPDGPVIVNPVSALRSLKPAPKLSSHSVMAIISRSLKLEFLPSESASPATFKKAAMRELQHSICPFNDSRKAVTGQLHYSCLVAGLGNKTTDTTAYKEIGIPHIFFVNPRGKVHVFHVDDAGYTRGEEDTTYGLMAHRVEYFPAGPFPARDG